MELEMSTANAIKTKTKGNRKSMTVLVDEMRRYQATPIAIRGTTRENLKKSLEHGTLSHVFDQVGNDRVYRDGVYVGDRAYCFCINPSWRISHIEFIQKLHASIYKNVEYALNHANSLIPFLFGVPEAGKLPAVFIFFPTYSNIDDNKQLNYIKAKQIYTRNKFEYSTDYRGRPGREQWEKVEMHGRIRPTFVEQDPPIPLSSYLIFAVKLTKGEFNEIYKKVKSANKERLDSAKLEFEQGHGSLLRGSGKNIIGLLLKEMQRTLTNKLVKTYYQLYLEKKI